jgi:hypothetical protein
VQLRCVPGIAAALFVSEVFLDLPFYFCICVFSVEVSRYSIQGGGGMLLDFAMDGM